MDFVRLSLKGTYHEIIIDKSSVLYVREEGYTECQVVLKDGTEILSDNTIDDIWGSLEDTRDED